MADNKVSFSPAQLKGMSETQISSLFHSSNWEQLDGGTRLNLCQEVENRLAAMDNVEPRTVVAEHMNGACYGYQQGDKIAVNVDMLNDGVFRTTFTDENGNKVTTEHDVKAPSWNTYDTIVHEHTHGVSEDQDKAPYTYIQSETDHDLYRIQGEEKNAYDAGNRSTLSAIQKAEAAMGKEDPSKADYIKSITEESYTKSLENAQMRYNDPVIDKTLAQFIADRDKGITRENASPSYKAIEALYDKQLERQMQELMDNKEAITQKDVQLAAQQAAAATKEEVLSNSEKYGNTQTQPSNTADPSATPAAAGKGASVTTDNENDGMGDKSAAVSAGMDNGKGDGMDALAPSDMGGQSGSSMGTDGMGAAVGDGMEGTASSDQGIGSNDNDGMGPEGGNSVMGGQTDDGMGNSGNTADSGMNDGGSGMASDGADMGGSDVDGGMDSD